ncbi:DUF2141 domain-containing protein [Sphingosinicella xenopeptidilytica]|uniref:DUF2141 domain-containing protein n=1 Tax=Sphingosinicella xenopeptidilytica TaxID=364098 RepID=A0ABW3C697_SPHXN
MLKRVLIMAACLPLLGAAPPPQASLHLTFEGLRSQKGTIRLCLWRDASGYPDCTRGTGATKESVTASNPTLDITGLPPGEYAVSAIHDENDNRKLDKSFIGMPTEGVAFSNNAKIAFGPPKFEKVRFHVEGETTQTMRMRYFL